MPAKNSIRVAMVLATIVCGGKLAQAQSGTIDGELIASAELVKAACAEKKVVIYSAQGDAAERAITADFKKDFPCIDVAVVSLTTGRQSERIKTEALAGQIQADVSLITDEALARSLINNKLARPWTPPAADKFPANAKVEGWWYAGSGARLYPVYNSDLVSDKEAPKSWKEILDPKWKDQIGAASIAAGGTPWMMYYFLNKVVSEEYLKELAALRPKLFSTYQPLGLAVARGEIKIALLADVVEFPLRTHQGAPIKPIYPTEGVPFVNYPMLLLDKSPNPKAGELLANWYVSKRGQAALVRVRGASSARSDVAPAKGTPTAEQLKLWNPGSQEIIDNFQAFYAKADGIMSRR